MKKSVLIVGKNSFIGRNIIEKIPDFNYKEYDIANRGVDELSFYGIDTVIYLAAIVHQTKEIKKEKYFEINSDLAFNVAVKAKENGLKHFVFFSSIKVYGDGGYKIVRYDENSRCTPVDNYGKSKLDAERRILELADDEFIVSIIRPSMVYGKGVKANMALLIKLIQKLPIIPLGGINNKRSMVSLNNLATIVEKVVDFEQTGVYLACDPKPVSTTELITKLNKSLELNKKIIKLPPFVQSVFKLIMPFKSRRVFGSFYVDPTLTLEKLNLQKELIPMEIALKEINYDH